MTSATFQTKSHRFPASLGAPERLFTFAVGYGVGLGAPTALGATFALATGQLWLQLLPLPFVLALALAFALHQARASCSRRTTRSGVRPRCKQPRRAEWPYTGVDA
jgi:hypothetical protein